MQPDTLTPEQLCELNLEAPAEIDVTVNDITAPLTHALTQAAVDLANERARLRAWQRHADLLAQQVAALKTKLAAQTSKNGVTPLQKIKAEV